MSLTLPEVINNIILAPEGIQVSFSSLTRASMDDGIPIVFLHAG